MRWKSLTLAFLTGSFTSVGPVHSQMDGYQSPYEIVFTVAPAQLLEPDLLPPRNDMRLESTTPYDQWYSSTVRQKYGPWGPEPQHYPPIFNLEWEPVAWQRQRLLAVASGMIGLPYQHHHIPDWEPSANWPWKPVALGKNSKGLDCSNFTSWLYNYGLGIKLKTDVRKQAILRAIPGPGGNGVIEATVIHNDNGYDDLIRKLKTGDLLYIKNREGNISHVIMWVGGHGRSPDGAPLVIDCTDQLRRDCNGRTIPGGVRLRPFLVDTWYFKNFAHAHRIIKDN